MGENLTCKVTDFGMARNTRSKDIYERTSEVRNSNLVEIKQIKIEMHNYPFIYIYIYTDLSVFFQGRLPLKWTALESLEHGRYTTKSDV